VAPTPTHPQDHGNRKRIFEICRALQDQGAKIHYLHYPAEHDWRSARPLNHEAAMRERWDGFDTVAPTVPLHMPPKGKDHRIDDWSDPAVKGYVAWLCRVQSFDVAIVNYTWMSFCLDAIPADTYKICDSHDVFAGRRQVLEAQGIEAEFFHTTEADEAFGLARADLVWAIKDSERDYFERELKLPHCLTMLHAEPARGWWTQPPSTDGWLRAGVIGARNNVNKRNLEQFLEVALPVIRNYMAPVKIVIAGGCSDDFRSWSHPNVEVLGRVPDVADFYRSMDVVLAPMQFSTGLKIKVGEALATGAPVLAHAHAMEGYPTSERLHQLHSFDEMARELVKLAFDPAGLIPLARASHTACTRVNYEVLSALEASRRSVVENFAGMIFVVAPIAALNESNPLYDHLVAAMDYLRFSAPIALYLTGAPTKVSRDFFGRFEQKIPVFADPALAPHLDPATAADWVCMKLPEVLERRGFRIAYFLSDCADELIFGTGKLEVALVRHDAVTLAGGDANRLVDVLRTTAKTSVLGADSAPLMHWLGQHGIDEVVEIPFGRNWSFAHMERRAQGRRMRQRLVVLGDPDDLLVQGAATLAERLGWPVSVLNTTTDALRAAVFMPPAAPEDDPVGLLAEAELVADLSENNAVTELLLEAGARWGIPYIRAQRGAVAAALQGDSEWNAPTSLADILRTLARALSEPKVWDTLAKEAGRELANRTRSDAGWTWLWGTLAPLRKRR